MSEQLDIFSELYPKFVIDKPIRLIELFAGIGSQAKALTNLGVCFEHWKVVEFDKYAIKSYNAVHGTNFETSDIREVHAADLDLRERERFCYIMTYSFPCQDLSVAGNQRGMKKGSGTRSGLLWEVERILDECGTELPHVLLMENVPMVIAEKNIDDFYAWRGKLESLGYSSYVQILNAKDYGIPQNRARCFMVSLLGEWSYTFPQPKELKLRLKDMLEENVDEKYYVSERGALHYKSQAIRKEVHPSGRRHSVNTDGKGSEQLDRFICERWGGYTNRSVELGYIDKGTGKHQSNTIYSKEGLARTMQATDWKSPMMIEDET